MGNPKKEADAEDAWARWRSIQLTPEQKAELRKDLAARVEKARRDGVYERLLELQGTFHLGLDLETLAELREDRD